MMIATTPATGLSLLVLVGSILILAGTVLAVRQRDHLGALIGFGAVVEAGVACLGWGYGGSAGLVGGTVVVLVQVLARLLAFGALLQLAGYGGRLSLAALRGSGQARPVSAALFGFGLFATIGISPFMVPDGRLLVLHAARGAGGLTVLILSAVSALVMAWLTIRAVQAVCLESRGQRAAPVADRPAPYLWALAGLLALGGVFEHLVTGTVAIFLGQAPAGLPHLTDGWHAAALVPFAGAFVVWGVGRIGAKPRNLLAVVLTAASLGLAVADGGLDPLSRLFAVITGGIGLAVVAYSTGYIHGPRRENGYYFFLLLMQGALMGLATTRAFGSFYVFWELMTWASYFLIVHEGTPQAYRAGVKYFVMCAGGAAFMLPGLLLLGGPGQGLDFAAVAVAAANLDPTLLIIALFLVLVGFAVKAGLVPLHSWLPEAHPVAPSSISAPLSGLLTKTGIYGLVRVFLAVCGGAVLLKTGQGIGGLSWIATVLTTIGVLTMVYGELMALRENDVKRMLAYSTMGQLGEIALVLGLSTWLATTAALSHVLNHAVMKNLLFLCAGALIMRAGSRKLEDLAGLGRVMPWTAASMVVGLLAIMGLPPFAGFSSKYLMLRACVAAGHIELAAALLLASLAGAVYYMRIVRQLVFKPYAGPAVSDAPWSMRLPILGLAGLCVLFGLAPQLNLALVLPVADMLAGAGKLAAETLPTLSVSWPIYVILPMLGAVLPVVLRHDRRAAGWSAAGVLAASALLVLLLGRGLDTLSFLFVLAVPVMGCLNMVYAVGYMEHSHTQWRFYTFFLFMAGGLMGVAASPDLFSFFTFWEIMSSWSLYFVIVHDEFPQALSEGYKYFFFNVLGAAFLFLGVVLVVAAAGSPDFAALRDVLPRMPGWLATLAFACMALGFGMKAAQLPWRIDIQMHPATAPTPVSGYISSVLLKSALFGLVKLFFVLGGGAFLAGAVVSWHQGWVMYGLAWVGGLTIVMAALMAILQSNFKLVLIYSTVSQLGYMVLGVSLGTALGVAGGLLHLFNHMLFKDLLFLVAGALIVQTHKHSLDELGGIGRKMPATLAVFAIGAMCVVGVPPSNGFTSKWIIYHALMQQGEVVLAILSLVGSVLTLAYFAKYLHAAFLGQPSPELEHVTEAPRVMLAPMFVLAGGCVLTSVLPGLFLAPVAGVLADLGLGTLDVAPWGLTSGPGAWNATAVSVLAVVAYGLGWAGLRALVGKPRVSPVHTCGVRLEPSETRMSARGIYGVPARMLQSFTAVFVPAAKE
jgi:formate hydrogenlyase subunit 3/multisubunit Na+/H+ antiporter MnhD subunit